MPAAAAFDSDEELLYGNDEDASPTDAITSSALVRRLGCDRATSLAGLACILFGTALCLGAWRSRPLNHEEEWALEKASDPEGLAFEAGMLTGLHDDVYRDTYELAGCRDTPFWTNGYNCRRDRKGPRDGCSAGGWTCEGYHRQRWCAGGRVTAHFAKGGRFNYPELNCCVCGADPGDDEASCREIGCHSHHVHHQSCQCHPDCETHHTCCPDYRAVCGARPPQPTTPPRPAVWTPSDQSLLRPSGAPALTFYMYRAQTAESFPPLNVNTASLGAVLWYLHNEVVVKCPRRGTVVNAHDITRILRYKVVTKATEPLYHRGMNFGVKCSYDFGACTGPRNRHGEDWAKYGYFVGCNVVGQWPHEKFSSALRYPQAYWYSLPGQCPNEDVRHKDPQCVRAEPGGHCDDPSGRGDCTYSFEEAGEIDIDELVGIKPRWASHEAFCREGCKEYVVSADKGSCIDFWDSKYDAVKNAERVRKADALFANKYPSMPRNSDLPPPPCDFNRGRFYAPS